MKIRLLLLAFLFGSLFFSCSQSNNNYEAEVYKQNIFRYNQSEGLTSLDPAQAKNQANIWATSQVFNGLFEFTYDLSENPCFG